MIISYNLWLEKYNVHRVNYHCQFMSQTVSGCSCWKIEYVWALTVYFIFGTFLWLLCSIGKDVPRWTILYTKDIKQNCGQPESNIIDNSICRYLAGNGGLPCLTYLDLSGCWNIDGDSVKALVDTAPRLNPVHLFYCDNILDGPYPEEANGCQNLDCGSRLCCRYAE